MEKYLLLSANAVTLLRIPLSILFSVLFFFNMSMNHDLLIVIAVLIFISDVTDGYLARHFGSVSTREVGAVLDSTSDTFVIVTLTFCFYSAGWITFFLALLIFWTRWVITFVRLVSIISGEPYAKTRLTTKIKGWSYGLGMLYILVANEAPRHNEDHNPTSMLLVNGYLLFVTLFSAGDFIYAHRQVIIGALFGRSRPHH